MRRKECLKYHFTVEGETEKWYLEWLQKQINLAPDTVRYVDFQIKVEQNPFSFAKRVNPLSVSDVIHVCDIEGKEEEFRNKFQNVLINLKKSRESARVKYDLAYSNFTFELWMILHKQDCNGSLSDRTQYLRHINRAYSESFSSLDEYKEESKFKKCLLQLNLDNVKQAITRAERIMNNK